MPTGVEDSGDLSPFAQRAEHNSIDPVRVWVVGGLGSQLDGFAAGLVIAGTTGRPLVLDFSIVSSSRNPDRGPSLAQIDVHAASPVPLELIHIEQSWRSRAARGQRRFLGMLAAKGINSRYLYGFSELRLRSPNQVRWIAGNMGPWSIRISAIAAGLKFPLTLRDSVLRQVCSGPLPDPQGWVAVHVRLGDFRTYANGAFKLGAPYYRRALKETLSNSDNVAIFSDEPDSAMDLIESCGINRHRIHNLATRIPAWDLVRMSHFDRIVCSNSSFSWWAALSSNASVVIVPSGVGRPRESWIEVQP